MFSIRIWRMEERLCDAAENGREEEVRKILKENKEVNVNCKDFIGWTALHCACDNGHDKVVTMLLAHPDIDVSRGTNTDGLLFGHQAVDCLRKGDGFGTARE